MQLQGIYGNFHKEGEVKSLDGELTLIDVDTKNTFDIEVEEKDFLRNAKTKNICGNFRYEEGKIYLDFIEKNPNNLSGLIYHLTKEKINEGIGIILGKYTGVWQALPEGCKVSFNKWRGLYIANPTKDTFVYDPNFNTPKNEATIIISEKLSRTRSSIP